MVDHSRWLISQALPGGQQATAKLRVFVAQLTTRTWSQIDSKTTMLFKHFFPKSHVGAERRLVEFNRLRTQIEKSQNTCHVVWSIERQPRRMRKGFFRKYASPSAGPRVAIERRSQIAQPIPLNDNVVINKRQNISVG